MKTAIKKETVYQGIKFLSKGTGHSLLGEWREGDRSIFVVPQLNLPNPPPLPLRLCSIQMIPLIGSQFSLVTPFNSARV